MPAALDCSIPNVTFWTLKKVESSGGLNADSVKPRKYELSVWKKPGDPPLQETEAPVVIVAEFVLCVIWTTLDGTSGCWTVTEVGGTGRFESEFAA